jgi:carbamoyltransferase
MLTLGLSDNHDASAALVQDRRLISACGQERVDRIKNSGVFPLDAMDATLDAAGLRYRDVDKVVLGSAFTPSWLLRRFPGFHHQQKKANSQFSPLLNAYILYQVALQKAKATGLETRLCRGLIQRQLRHRGLENTQVVLMDHHSAHAHSAYRTQSHDQALVFTLDAMGDGISATVWQGQNGQLNRLFAQSGLAAINTYYSRVTEFLGFTANRHEGKITGLAAYAEAPPELVAHFAKQLRFVEPGFSRTNYASRQHPEDAFFRVLKRFSREEIASALQAQLERAVCDMVRYWVKKTKANHVAVAGGTFANVKLNQRIAELPCVASLWVYPNMGDGGLAAGAALSGGEVPPHRLKTTYLGPDPGIGEMARALSRAGLKRTKPRNMALSVAKLLNAGKVVAHFDGAMEWGPRALGNRSLLVRPDDPRINEWLNERLSRTEFMPFAPIVRAEDAPRFFIGLEKAAEAARFMTVCFDCTDAFKKQAAGVVHVDGTARPQVLHEQDNPRLHTILTAFQDLSGLDSLVNTSFNLHEEPIVCTPNDAVRAWKEGRLDALSMGPFLVTQPADV